MHRPSIQHLLWAVRRLLRLRPPGYALHLAGPGVNGAIRGDLVPIDATVIIDRGRIFVRTGQVDFNGFEIYAEGHRTFAYQSE
ncbi:hypothetical protein [Devosia sediminis]|uniref:Uncharacterized protein n=1 Tax=Devosia sediminis TaxID=2798801 RepID=A0A934IQN2_9HYPH|nr:hypothetical protein [Devosia sediminis]MBJ3783411.1 hypothetical protein [Devosia sediminis]